VNIEKNTEVDFEREETSKSGDEKKIGPLATPNSGSVVSAQKISCSASEKKKLDRADSEIERTRPDTQGVENI
jgi:hypothetical protein